MGSELKVKTFKVEGEFRLKDYWRKFKVERRGVREEDVKEQLYSEFGGRYKLKRTDIKIHSLKALEEKA